MSSTKPILRATIVLPFALPTWNVLLRLRVRDRIRLTKFIRGFVSRCILDAGGSQIPTGSVRRPSLTAYERVVYSSMIHLSTSSRSHSRRRKAGQRKR